MALYPIAAESRSNSVSPSLIHLLDHFYGLSDVCIMVKRPVHIDFNIQSWKMVMMTKNKMLEKIYQAKSNAEMMDVYRQWAADYDKETVDTIGYVAHIASAEALARVLDDRDAAILDAGCGTGLVGMALVQRGFHNLDALDFSKEMLAESRRKHIYGQLFHADMNQPLAIESDCYDAVICVGSFSYCHVQATALDELVRITKPGGFICFTIREGAFEDCGYRERMSALEQKKAWTPVQCQNADYMKHEGVSCKLCTYQVLPDTGHS